MKKEKVVVIKGGFSTEREISLKSGAAVGKALREAGYEVEELDLQKGSLKELEEMRPDAAFLALHGRGGEDGAIQGALEWLNIPYTGPGIASSAICMDKILAKKVFCNSGIPTADFCEIGPEDRPRLSGILSDAAARLGLPLVLKASRQGSSIGTLICREKEALEEAAESLFPYGDRILIEAFKDGKELTVPVLGNEVIRALPVIEITSENEFYDFDSKYTPGKCRHIIPAGIDEKTEKEVTDIATRAYRACGCRGFSRVDFILDREGRPFVLEINTLPGMTEQSLFPDAARAAGMDFPALVDTIVRLALGKEE